MDTMAENINTASKENIDHEASLGYMIRLAAPVIVMTVSFTVMQFVDRSMVASLGTAELAAILPAGLVAFLPGTFMIGIAASVATFVSQSRGKGRPHECSSYAWQAIYMGLIYFAVVIAIMWPGAHWIFRMLGHSPDVIRLEVIYLRIMLLAQAVGVFIWVSSEFFMGIHRPIITMYASLIAQVINVTMNYVLIFGKWGFPAMGIAGAGWGTFIGMAVGGIIRMCLFLSPGIHSRFKSRTSLSVDLNKMIELLKIGLPAGFEMMVNVALWGVVLFGLIGRFGDDSLAATSAVFSTTHVSVMPVVGLKLALSVASGKAIGAGRYDIAIKQTWISLRAGILYMGVTGLAFLLFRRPIMQWWSPENPEVVTIGSTLLIPAAIYQVFHAMRVVCSGILRGAGDTRWLAKTSALGSGGILGIGGLIIAAWIPQIGALGPWLAASASIMVLGTAALWRFTSNRWMAIHIFRQPAGVPIEEEAAIE